VAEIRSGHAREILHLKIDTLISQGFTRTRIANYLGISPQAFAKEVSLAHQGKTFASVQAKLITNRIFSIIEQGYFSFTEISQFFKGYRAKNVFFNLKNTDKGNKYLKGVIASAVASLFSEESHITVKIIAKKLGIEKSWSSLGAYILKEMRGFDNLIRNYELYLSNLASKMITTCKNSFDLLEKLGWLQGINYDSEFNILKSSNEIERRIKFLFNINFAKAKEVHTSGYIGKS
jgi:hypothetical protein